ncbi:MAG: molybdopterin-dependent oxidoreductase [archaeon]|nr:molybdopterin-dependent oxidoreductase [Nanoarchaeota archaeon]
MVKDVKLLLAVFFILSICLLAISCQEELTNESGVLLSSIEIQEYQGEKLDSVNAFRENSISGPQHVDEESYNLRVTGLINKQLSMPYQESIKYFDSYQKVVTLQCVEGWDATILWEGFLVRDLLDLAEVQDGANTVIFYAYDGYSSSFPIEYFYDNDIIIAYKMNNVTLPPERGFPFQLVAESKYGYKWVKWITEIKVSDDEDYEGYWESRGYSDTGNLDESKYK